MLTPACLLVAAPVEAWTPELHSHHTWLYGPLGNIGEEIGQMVANNVPPGIWSFVWPALVVGALVDLFCDQVCTMVHDETFTGSLLTDAPVTLVEKEVRGQLATMLTLWETYGDVPCVLKAYMALTFKSVQIQMMREGYGEHVRVDIITGTGYRRVVWPTLIAQAGPGAWQHIEPVAMKERTAALLCKAVFRLD